MRVVLGALSIVAWCCSCVELVPPAAPSYPVTSRQSLTAAKERSKPTEPDEDEDEDDDDDEEDDEDTEAALAMASKPPEPTPAPSSSEDSWGLRKPSPPQPSRPPAPPIRVSKDATDAQWHAACSQCVDAGFAWVQTSCMTSCPMDVSCFHVRGQCPKKKPEFTCAECSQP